MKYGQLRPALGLVVTAACLPVSGMAEADEDYFKRQEIVPVSERAMAETAPVPIAAAGFEVRPEVVFAAGTQSNVLATDGNELDDTAVGFAPRMAMVSTWAKHEFGLDAEIDHLEYSDLKDESRTNLKIKLRGRLDLGEQTSLQVHLKTIDETEDRTALASVPNALEPNEYSQVGAGIGVQHQAGRWRVAARLGLDTFDHDDAELADDLFQDQDFRDRDVINASARLAYALNRDVALFADIRQEEGDYDPPNFFNALNRDYSGTVVLVGSEFELGRSIRGDIGIGYQSYTYDELAFEDIDDLAFAGSLDVALGPRTTLSLDADRTVTDPGIALSNAALTTRGRLRLEQGLTAKLSVSGEAGVTQYAFESIERDDDRTDLKLAGHWKINPNIWLEGNYQVIDQSSDVQAFTDNRMFLRMRIFP